MARPDSLPWMESVDAKVTRAKHHLKVFDDDAARYLEEARPRFIRKVDPQARSHWFVVFVEDPIPPIDLSILIGEFLYNLRSALDNLVCGMVRRGNPSSSCAGRQFPIYKDSADYLANRRSNLRGVPKDARKLIDGFQPYCRPPGSVELDPLWILNKLCNQDKHRAANLTFGYSKDVRLRVPLKSGQYLQIALGKPIYGGDVETIPLPGDPDSMEDEVKIEIIGRSMLALREPDRWADRPVDEILVACLQYVEDRVIPRFKPFFG